MLNFEACKIKELVGAVRRIPQAAPLAHASSRPQIALLLEFAQALRPGPGMVAALRACMDDLHMDGSYWLVKVLSCSFQVEEDTVHATDEFLKRVGWTVVVEAQ